MIDLLILLLKEIDSDSSILVINSEYSCSHPLVNAAKYVAHECLSYGSSRGSSHGCIANGCVETNKDMIVKAGFRVFPNDISRYGWVTGYIILSRGIITYRIVFPNYI